MQTHKHTEHGNHCEMSRSQVETRPSHSQAALVFIHAVEGKSGSSSSNNKPIIVHVTSNCHKLLSLTPNHHFSSVLLSSLTGRKKNFTRQSEGLHFADDSQSPPSLNGSAL